MDCIIGLPTSGETQSAASHLLDMVMMEYINSKLSILTSCL